MDVRMPDGTIVTGVPEGITQEDLLARYKAYKTPPAKPSSISNELGRGWEQFKSSSRTGIAGILNPEEAALENIRAQEDIAARRGEGPSLERLKRTYEEEGTWAAAKELGRQIPQAVSQQLPQIGAMATGARLGAMAGSTVGPAGTVIGGALGAGAALLPQFFGENITRQAEAQRAAGKPLDISRTEAGVAAAGQAALEGAGTAFTLGGRLVKGILGIADDKALRTAMEIAKRDKTAERGFLDTVTRGMARGTTEIPVEVGQAVIERAQAGLPLLSEDALKEYGENAYMAGLVGPTIGAPASVYERGQARGEIAQEMQAKQQAESAKARAEQQAAAQAAAESEAQRKLEESRQYESTLNEMGWGQLRQQEEILKKQEQTPETKLMLDRIQQLKHDIHEREMLAQREQKSAKSAEESAAVFEGRITEAALRDLGLRGKSLKTVEELVGMNVNQPDQLARIREVLGALADRTKSPGLATRISDLPFMRDTEPFDFGELTPEEQAVIQDELVQEQTAQGETGGELDQSTLDLWDAAVNLPDQSVPSEPTGPTAAQQERVTKDTEWAARMAEQTALAQAQKEFEAKRNAEAKAKLDGAFAAAQEASRKRAEQRAAERAAVNGWGEAERQKALDEEFIVEDTRNKEAFAQAAAGTQGELTGIGAQPRAEAAGPKTRAEFNDEQSALMEQYLAAQARAGDPNAEAEMRDIADLWKEQYGVKSWFEAKYGTGTQTSTQRTQKTLDLTGERAKREDRETAKKAKEEEAKKKAEEERAAAEKEAEKQRKEEERKAKAEAKKKAEEEAKRAAEIDPVQLVADLQAISTQQGNTSIGKRARQYINEAKQGDAGSIAAARAFADENKAAPKAKTATAEVKKAAKEVEVEDIDAQIAALQNKLAEEDAKDEPNQNRVAALENQISKLRRQRVKTTKADMEEAVSADRDVPNVTNGDLQWKDIHSILSGETTLVDALNTIRQIPNLSENQKALIDALLRSKAVQTASFEVAPRDKTTDKGETQTGGYDPSDNAVTLYNGGGIKTLLHEAVHSAIFGALETDQAFKAQMEELLARAKASVDPKAYGLTNVQEFAAEAMANPAFQAELAQIPASGTVVSKLNNLWRKFVDATRALLGIGPQQATLLDEVLSAVIPRMGGEFISVRRAAAPNVSRAEGLATLDAIGYNPKPAPDTPMQRATKMLNSVREMTPAEATRNFVSMADKFRTKYVSSNTAFMNAVRRELMAQGKANKELTGALLAMSDSQALHSEAVAHEYVLRGGVEFDPETAKWRAVDTGSNFKVMHQQVAAMMEAHGLSQEEASAVMQAAFEARRIQSLSKSEKAADLTLHMTDAQVQRAMTLFKTYPELNKIANTWDSIRKNTIKILQDTGVYSAEQAKAYMDSIGYVPFYRDMSDLESAGDIMSVQASLRAKKEKHFTGSKREVNDIVDNMSRWVMFGIDRAIRNAQAVRMVDFAINEMPDGFAARTTDSARSSARVLRDGKFEYYEFQDPLFAAAFNGLESFGPQMPKLAVQASNLLRKSVVLNPLFGLSQVSQDALGAIFTSGLSPKYAFKVPFYALKEFVKTLRGTSKIHEELKSYGVVGAPDFSAAVARIDAEIEAGFRKLTKSEQILRGLRRISMASDSAVRQAVYELAKEQGLSGAEALEKSFEIINFRRAGTSRGVRAASQVIPFFNAYIQAMNVAYKVATGEGISPGERKAALWNLAHATAMSMAFAMAYAALVSDDDDYINKETAVRDRLLIIPGTGLSLPMRPDVFVLPKVLAEHTYLYLTDHGTEDGAKFRKSMATAGINAILGPTPMPQVFKPFVEVALNRNFFTGRDLLGSHMKQLATEEQYTNTTSELGKSLGKTGMVSPIVADHIIRGVFGSVGGAVLWASNQMLSAQPGTSRPDTSTWELMASVPGMGQFMVKEHGAALKTDFYDMKKEVDEVVTTFNELKKNKPDRAREYIMDEDRLKLYGMQSAVNSVNKSLSEIRTAIKFVTNAPDTLYSSEQKRDKIEELRLVEERVLKGINIKRLRELSGM